MRFALLTLLSGALVTALTGEEALEKWGGPRGGDKVSHGGNNIGNGDGGGIDIDTGGGDIGDIGVGIGGGGGGGSCDPAACDAKCRGLGDQSGYCDNGSGSPKAAFVYQQIVILSAQQVRPAVMEPVPLFVMGIDILDQTTLD
ncbi:hypothetical protein PENARI_c181G00115 [Penicillium arizonense]|uniref:Uncharacterized protein n=1 Tax=Penicillium arizonense TaxID=1835702 RepID=A0A1F5L0S0_PENAI|nr:hypothetical protein PENARI_c181G00115 [Penicillium arizonense]OGE46580.1 hypothetical protein PENARI_c181G00115 [Penicillium arizonense]